MNDNKIKKEFFQKYNILSEIKTLCKKNKIKETRKLLKKNGMTEYLLKNDKDMIVLCNFSFIMHKNARNNISKKLLYLVEKGETPISNEKITNIIRSVLLKSLPEVSDFSQKQS